MLLEKRLDGDKCIFCAVSLNFVEDFCELVAISADGFEDGLAGAFACDFSRTALFNGTEIMHDTVIKIFVITQTIHGGMCIPTGVSLS